MSERIVYLVQGMGTGGLERVVLHLACEMVRRGHGVTICCYDKRGELATAAEEAGVKVELIPRRRGVDLRYIWRLGRWLKKQRPYVLHMHNETALFYGTLAGRLARVPILIYTEHDGVFPRSLLSRWANRRLVKRLTHAVAVSEAVKQLWCQSDGIDPARVKVVPNGVPVPKIPVGQGTRSEPGRLRIGTVGRLSHEKGMDVLIEAFALVKAQLPQAELLLVGDGAERPRLEGMVVERGLTDSVRFLGIRDDVPSLMTSFDIFVLPSRSEGLPLAILEAMAAGLPIVATNVGGVSEAVQDGKMGFLLPPEEPKALADAIIKLAGDEELRSSLGRLACVRFNEQYELSFMVNSYEKLMEIQ